MTLHSAETKLSAQCVELAFISAFEQLFEGSADLLDHVGGGGGSTMSIEGLPVTLPGQ